MDDINALSSKLKSVSQQIENLQSIVSQQEEKVRHNTKIH